MRKHIEMKVAGRAAVAALAMAAVCDGARANDAGSVLFSDTFESHGTFAENWVADHASSEGGAVRFAASGGLHMRGVTPVEFVADVDIMLDPSWSKRTADGKRGWSGLFVKPFYSFAIRPDGTTYLVYKRPGDDRSLGANHPIPGYVRGQPVHLQVVRRLFGETEVKYLFYVNGKHVGDFTAPMPNLVKNQSGRETYDPPYVFAYREPTEADNFSLATVKHGDESPNLIANSGFEYDLEGIPPFYGLQGEFNWTDCPYTDYEKLYLKRFSVDTAEKHSGKQSLRVNIDRTADDTLIRPFRAGTTVAGKPGVFSVWMKASIDNLLVLLQYGEAWVGRRHDGYRVVTVDREWKRYEVTRDTLPAVGVYSPIWIHVNNRKVPACTLWIDDLQAEIVQKPEGGFDVNKSYATAWKAADGDKSRFTPVHHSFAKPAPSALPKLPAGLKPTADLGTWKDKALIVRDFYEVNKKPTVPTEGYLACDDENLYVGCRAFGDDPSRWCQEKLRNDAVAVCGKPSLEIFFAPYGGGDYLHFCADPLGNRFDMCFRDFAFDGTWTSAVKKGEGYTDWLVTFPLKDFAAAGLRDRWGVNLCRNMTGKRGWENVSMAKTKVAGFNQVPFYPEVVFPAGVLDRFRTGAEFPPYGLHKPDPKAATGGRRLLGRLDFYMNEPEAKFRVWEMDGSMHEEVLDIRQMPCGTNKVTVSGLETTVVKFPYRKGATQVNRWTRSLIYDGTKLFPTAYHLGNLEFLNCGRGLTNMFDFIAASGFKETLKFCHARKAYMPTTVASLRLAQERGILVNVFGSPFFIRPGYNDMISHQEWYDETHFDNVFEYFVIDEPELWTTSAEAKRQLLAMKALYPYSPVTMNSTVMGIPQRFADLKTDILMYDDYLENNEGRDVWTVVGKIAGFLKAGEAEGKPLHPIVEAGVPSLHYRNCTYGEEIAQSWGCICEGATGLWWYEHFPTTEGVWKATVDVNREVKALVEPLLSEEICAPVRSDVDRRQVISMTKTLNGAWYVFTCNLEPEKRMVSYALPAGAPKDGTVEVLFENRTIPLRGGIFKDGYKPYQRHVYKIR